MGTNTQSKLIYGADAVQNPTDHYQIPVLMNQIVTNLNSKPSNRKNSNNLPENLFAIEYFVFDENKNVFICPKNQELTLDGAYKVPAEKSGEIKLNWPILTI